MNVTLKEYEAELKRLNKKIDDLEEEKRIIENKIKEIKEKRITKKDIEFKINFENCVLKMELDEKYLAPDSFNYKWLQIEKDEYGYTWSMEHNYDYRGRVGYIYPGSGNTIQHFKTEKGAKRNLIKYCSHIFGE